MDKSNIKTKETVIALSLSLTIQVFILVTVLFNIDYPFSMWWVPQFIGYLTIFSEYGYITSLALGFIVNLAGLLLVFLVTKKGIKGAAYGFIPILIIYLSNAVAGLRQLFSGFIYGIGGWEDYIQLLITLGIVILLFSGTATPSLRAVQKNKKSTYKESVELSDKEFLPALILCFFFGVIGIHRFYAGKIGTGLLMIFTLGGLGIWALIDFIMICVGSFRDIDGRIIKYQRAVYVTSNSSSSEMSIAAEIEKFSELKDKGIISEEEFNKKKEELLK